MKIIFSSNFLRDIINFRGCIIEAFIQQGHQVVLVAPQCDANMYPKIPAGVRVLTVFMDSKGNNPMNDIKYYKDLKAIYKEERPDYIFHFTIKPNIYGTLAAKSLGIRSSAMIAGLGHVYSHGGIGNAIARVMYKYAMKFPEKVMVLNQDNYNTLINRKVVSAKRLLWLEGGEGVDLVKFTPSEVPNNEKPVFLMVSRVLYEKGYAEYIETARSLKGKAIFRIMGFIDSHPSAVSRQTIDADVSDGAIEYIEFTPEVIVHMSQADCVVLPSYHEGLSRVLMEALAMAKPIITTDIPGCRETVHDNVNGFLCKPKSAQSLIEAVNKFLELTPQQRNEMGNKGRQLAQNVFDEKNVIKVYQSIIKPNA